MIELKMPAVQLDPSAGGSDDRIDMLEIMRTLWRGKLVIGVCVALAVLIGGYHVFFRAVPIYTATSVVMLENRQEQFVDLESVVTGLSGDQATINTEVERLRSRRLAERLVERLDLVSDPEFNKRLRPEPSFSIRAVIDRVRGLLRDGGDALPGAPDAERSELVAVITSVLEKIEVKNIRDSYVFRITVRSWSPVKSALIANTLADLYIMDQIEQKFASTEKATDWLSERVQELQVELEEAVAAVKNFNSGTNLISPEALAGLNRQLKETRDRLRETETGRAAAATVLARLEAARETGDVQEMARVSGDASLLRMARDMAPDERPAFDTRFGQVLGRAELDLSRAENQVQALRTSIDTQQVQIDAQSADLVQLQQLEREAEASRLIYEYFLNRLKETSVQQGIQQADSSVLSEAVVPVGPSAPRVPLILMISAVLGAIAGMAIVLLREATQSTFRTAETLEARTGHVVLGQVPDIPARNRKSVLTYLRDKPTSAAAEAFRNLRTSVLLSDIDTPPQVIMSTSSVPGEGKTTQSLALAQNLAGMGKKVLLIEGDIRRRVFAKYFGRDDRKGLISVLSGDLTLGEAVLSDPLLAADMLFAEKTSANAADVFSSDRFRGLLRQARGEYDYIVIDTPPVLVVPDARIIGQCVDAILYTVKWDSTPQRQVREGLRAFESVNVKVTGLVLGQISADGMKRYGYGEGYAAYSSYYDN